MQFMKTGHPDHAWIARARDALARWEATAPTAPTSSVLGSGAIAAAEMAFSQMHDRRPALLLPSATYALRVALEVLGVSPGDEVLCPVIDWSAAFAAITSLGATPVTVAVDPQTLTIDPDAAAGARTPRTRALVACHLHGVCADIPALRTQLPDIGICEDASQAFGALLDGHRAATLGDVAVLSLGPGKHIDAGEGGVLLCRSARLHKRAIETACHPLRNLLSGTTSTPSALIMRPHPIMAVLALHQLAQWSPSAVQKSQKLTSELLIGVPNLSPLTDGRRRSTQPYVPVLVAHDTVQPPAGITWTPSGAQVLPPLASTKGRNAQKLLSRVRLAMSTARQF